MENGHAFEGKYEVLEKLREGGMGASLPARRFFSATSARSRSIPNRCRMTGPFRASAFAKPVPTVPRPMSPILIFFIPAPSAPWRSDIAPR